MNERTWKIARDFMILCTYFFFVVASSFFLLCSSLSQRTNFPFAVYLPLVGALLNNSVLCILALCSLSPGLVHQNHQISPLQPGCSVVISLSLLSKAAQKEKHTAAAAANFQCGTSVHFNKISAIRQTHTCTRIQTQIPTQTHVQQCKRATRKYKIEAKENNTARFHYETILFSFSFRSP